MIEYEYNTRDQILAENETRTWQDRREAVDNYDEDTAPKQIRVQRITEEHFHRPNIFATVNYKFEIKLFLVKKIKLSNFI